jgi:hypothetical protein
MGKARLVAPFESYSLFPMIVALAVIGIDRSGLSSLLKFPLFIGLFIATIFLSRSSASLLVLFIAVLL